MHDGGERDRGARASGCEPRYAAYALGYPHAGHGWRGAFEGGEETVPIARVHPAYGIRHRGARGGGDERRRRRFPHQADYGFGSTGTARRARAQDGAPRGRGEGTQDQIEREVRAREFYRHFRGDAEGLCAHPPGGEVERQRLDRGSQRNRQGARRARAPQLERTRQRAVCRRGVRRLEPHAARERTFRSREGCVYRCDPRTPGALRTRRRRHFVSRRNKRNRCFDADKTLARLGDANFPARRRRQGYQDRHPHNRRDEPQSARICECRQIPRGSVLSAQCDRCETACA